MTGFEQAFEAMLSHYGVPALFATITLESLGAPLPGESALMLASGAAAAGKLDIWAVALAAFLGAVLGDNIGYLIGRKLGRGPVLRAGARFGITEAGFAKAEAITRRYGPWMVAIARFVVLLRQLNGLVAGTTGMPWHTFILANMAGAALWVGLWTTLAYRFGHEINILPRLWHHLSLVGAVGIVLLLVALVWVALRRRHP